MEQRRRLQRPERPLVRIRHERKPRVLKDQPHIRPALKARRDLRLWQQTPGRDQPIDQPGLTDRARVRQAVVGDRAPDAAILVKDEASRVP